MCLKTFGKIYQKEFKHPFLILIMANLLNYKQQLLDNYDFEINNIIKEIKKNKAKIVCLQFPEGLKAIAPDVAIEIEKNTDSVVLIWIDSCFGACDTPIGLEKIGVDMLIQFGHAPWDKRNK